MVQLAKPQAVERINQQVQRFSAITYGPDVIADFTAWKASTYSALRNIFGEHSSSGFDFEEFKDRVDALETLIRYSANAGAFPTSYREMADEIRSCLRELITEVNDYWDDVSPNAAVPQVGPVITQSPKPLTRDVFIVHGHDDGLKEATARFLSQLDLNPIILHERPNEGQTILEKFDKNADVSFAVALLTPDDLGGSVKAAKSMESLRHRARQNVVLELGYFLGRIGRKCACALVKGELELPSDYMGVVYIRVDDGGAWRYLLAKELRAAGLEVDLNKL